MSSRIERAVRKVNEAAPGRAGGVPQWQLSAEIPFGGSHVARLRLDNGLTLLLLVDRSAPVVAYYTWFRVGSRHERPGKTGLAHLFEHLMFNETEDLAAGEFDRKLEESGAETNAATWLDWTFYHEALPKDRLGLAIRLESSRMSRLVLREPQVASEKEVVANERRYRVEDDVDGAASELLYRTAFTVHPYHWPTIGWMDDIAGFTPEDCEAFYRTYYAPNNAILVVVGDVDEADVLRKVGAAYGGIPAATIPEEDTRPEPAQTEDRQATLVKPTASERVSIAWHGPALGDADHPALTVLNEILMGGRASRLYRSFVVERELVTDLRGWPSTFRDPGIYEIGFTARPGKTKDDILPLLDEALARAREELVTDEELARAKARLELGLLGSLDTAAGKAEQIGFNEIVLGDPAAGFRRLEVYRRITRGEIRTAARRYLSRPRTVVHVIPERGGA